MIIKILHRKLKTDQHEPTENGCSERLGSSCSTYGIRRDILVIHPVIGHE
jgi:hypothetical protein